MGNPKPGAVIYAKDLSLVSAFYRDVAGLTVRAVEPDHVVLESSDIELIVLQVPPGIAKTITIANPPKRRIDAAIKLVFPVASISTAREAAARCHGELNPLEREWTFQHCVVCDGQDPEGNVLQLRQSAP